MEFKLKYGIENIEITLPESTIVLKGKELPKKFNPEGFYNDFIEKIVPLVYRAKKIGIVVSDKSRRCNYPELLPIIEKALKEKSTNKKDITFFIAYGTHASQTDKESIVTYGEIYNKYRFIHHPSDLTTSYKYIGNTSKGTEVKVRKDILELDLIITVGSISFHYFAGFGGGRKLLFPGLASKDSILHNHRLFLDTKTKQLHSACKPGMMEGNPIAEDLKEIAGMLPQHIEVHGLLNGSGELIDTIIGDTYADLERACTIHKKNFKITYLEKYNIVIASAGGYPKDINFIQVHKAIHHASLFAKEGGKIIVFADHQCFSNPCFSPVN